MPSDKLDASEIVVRFKDEQEHVNEVPVSDLMNDMFNCIFQLESRIAEIEKHLKLKKNVESPIITLDYP